MNLDDFIITCFCTIDEILPIVTKGKRLIVSHLKKRQDKRKTDRSGTKVPLKRE